MFDQQFIDEVIELALQIAKRQRGENHLQWGHILRRKFQAECQELAEAATIWDEIPDVVYYAACLTAEPFAEDEPLAMVQRSILPRYGVSVAQAKAATLAKYRLRAAGEPKNIEKERAAILAAIAE